MCVMKAGIARAKNRDMLLIGKGVAVEVWAGYRDYSPEDES